MHKKYKGNKKHYLHNFNLYKYYTSISRDPTKLIMMRKLRQLVFFGVFLK